MIPFQRVQTTDRLLNQLQQNIFNAVNPVIQNPLVNGIILKDVILGSGTNVINHLLGRTLQGWFPTRISASATFYDKQSINKTPETTLILVASAPCTVSLYVF